MRSVLVGLATLVAVLTLPVHGVGPAYAQVNPAEVTFWESVRDSNDQAEYEAYLREYPEGKFAPLARIRVKKLNTGSTAKTDAKAEDGTRPNEDAVLRHRATAERDEKKAFSTPNGLAGEQGWLGVNIHGVTPEFATSLGMKKAGGALVRHVLRNGPAEQAGLRAGDVILKWDGKDVPDPKSLFDLVAKGPPGKYVDVAVRRRSKERVFQVKVGNLGASISPPVHDCDRLAAHPNYAVKGVVGVQGDVIPTDRAVKACRAALADHPDAERFQYQLGRALHYGKFYDEARRGLRVLAEKGHAGAALNLGLIYAHGRGVPKDYAQAAHWFRQASEGGEGVAMTALGFLYREGLGVRQSDQQALAWSRKAIAWDEPQGFYQLATMYAGGHGVPKDMEEAARLHRQAANMGVAESMYSLGRMHSHGDGVAKDKVEAVHWYRKAAEIGHPEAMVNLGFVYHAGEGVEKDLSKAANWYRKAVEKGNATAQNNLGILYNDGTGVPRDCKKAARLLLDAYCSQDKYAIKNLEEQSNAVLDRETRRELQRLLKQQGLYTGAIDGLLGPGTKGALRALATSERAANRVRASSSTAPEHRELEAPAALDRLPGSSTGDCDSQPCLRAVGRTSDPPVAMYERPRAWAKAVGKIPAGATNILSLGKTAISASVKWLHVEYERIQGWVPAQFLNPVTVDQTATTTAPEATERGALGLPPLEGLGTLD